MAHHYQRELLVDERRNIQLEYTLSQTCTVSRLGLQLEWLQLGVPLLLQELLRPQAVQELLTSACIVRHSGLLDPSFALAKRASAGSPKYHGMKVSVLHQLFSLKM
jgi:hypothetical protein